MFAHPDGHEIKIALSGLSPAMRKKLEAMPVHKKDGGLPSNVEFFNDEGASEAGGMPDVAPTPAPVAAAAPATPIPQTDVAASPTPDQATSTASDQNAVAPEQQPTAATSPTEQTDQGDAMPPPISAQELKIQDANWDQDLKNGHITPKTYADLFAKNADGSDRSTLGKIGTVFGLMLSGAGSGLTHQPNALLEMMNKEISNDLEAQKASKENAKNYIQLNLTHQLNMAQIDRLHSEGKLSDAQADLAKQEASMKGYTLARMQANRAALHHLVAQVNKYPVGSKERQNAEQQLAILSNGIQNENFDLADRAEAAGALGRAAFAQNQGNQDPEAEFQANQKILRLGGNKELADFNEARHMPGIPGLASVALTQADRDNIQGSQALMDL